MKHEVCPKEWRNTPNVTGDYDLDETIRHRTNSDMPHRLALHLRGPHFTYSHQNAYHGYKTEND